MYPVQADFDLLSFDTDKEFNKFVASCREVTAAGGLVENEDGEFLMIFRRGVWDLPKGHWEEGETLDVTALRETEEETGICGLKLGEKICVTRHTYILDGVRVLKHTHWWHMYAPKGSSLTPQTDEDIESVRWMSRAEAADVADNTWPSIREVFENI